MPPPGAVHPGLRAAARPSRRPSALHLPPPFPLSPPPFPISSSSVIPAPPVRHSRAGGNPSSPLYYARTTARITAASSRSPFRPFPSFPRRRESIFSPLLRPDNGANHGGQLPLPLPPFSVIPVKTGIQEDHNPGPTLQTPASSVGVVCGGTSFPLGDWRGGLMVSWRGNRAGKDGFPSSRE